TRILVRCQGREVGILRITKENSRQQSALWISLLEAETGLVGFGMIAGQVLGSRLALHDFLLALGQAFFVEQQGIGAGRLAVLSGELLGVRQFQQDLAAPALRVGILGGLLLGALGGAVQGFDRCFQSLSVSLGI